MIHYTKRQELLADGLASLQEGAQRTLQTGRAQFPLGQLRQKRADLVLQLHVVLPLLRERVPQHSHHALQLGYPPEFLADLLAPFAGI